MMNNLKNTLDTRAIIRRAIKSRQARYKNKYSGKKYFVRANKIADEAYCVELALTNAISYANKIIVLLNFY